MAHFYRDLRPNSDYIDRRSRLSREEWNERLRTSTTVYVGNLSFYTTEDQIYELFRKCGDVDMVVMGLNRLQKNPCGFCFVRYFNHASARRAVELLNGVRFDERAIRVDWDSGDGTCIMLGQQRCFVVLGITEESRKYGRGVHGVQWRDEFRKSFDSGRGGEGGGLEYQPPRRLKRPRYERARWERYGEASDRKKRR